MDLCDSPNSVTKLGGRWTCALRYSGSRGVFGSEDLAQANEKAATQDAIISNLRKELESANVRHTSKTYTTSSPYATASNSKYQYPSSSSSGPPRYQTPPVSSTRTAPSGYSTFGIPSAPPNTRRFPYAASSLHSPPTESPSPYHGGLQSFGPACEAFIDQYQLGDRLHGQLESLYANVLTSKWHAEISKWFPNHDNATLAVLVDGLYTAMLEDLNNRS